MRTRGELIHTLIDIQDFSDHEIAINARTIRTLLGDAIGHLKDATKISADNRRLRLKLKSVADAVQVVRCSRDCRYYQGGECEQISYIMDGYYHGTFEVKKPDDFCSFGEKVEKVKQLYKGGVADA